MPVILPEDYRATWLSQVTGHSRQLLSLLRPYPAHDMEVYPVSRLVNSPDNDGPECIRPLAV
jgi:putative SOS response-associated peptidase YedK